ncbi:DUF982 domain-containing protein [Mesorhizobium sp. LNHC221B00]|uniref:DUF982 domain-containing protein n=1 Tax=Mesorhizobium sp. LNHC221B00 TaxID=1287233 RepID=UPI001FD9277B|nr:DUF982 domain-containing protein [Mesorhizobium sp. LNHC221B00]
MQKIDCVMDAIEFLEEWPVEKRGLLHAAACEACYSAYDGRKPVEAAHKAFTTWARKIGVIEDVPTAPPWMTGLKRSVTQTACEGAEPGRCSSPVIIRRSRSWSLRAETGAASHWLVFASSCANRLGWSLTDIWNIRTRVKFGICLG